MRVIKAMNKDHLIEQIDQLENRHDEVYINLRPTKEIVQRIINSCSTMKTLYCPPSLLKQTARNALTHAKQNKITIIGGDFEVGRPKKYPEKTINEIRAQRQIGKPTRQISEEMGIPLRTVYFYLNNNR